LQYSSRTPPPPGISASIPVVPLWKTAPSEDEVWYVLEGELLFRLDTKTASAPAGAFVFVPRGTRHCFQIIGEQPAKT
jgi:mannose-6-phosphate isomerase-like protein (cupin superfamily)